MSDETLLVIAKKNGYPFWKKLKQTPRKNSKLKVINKARLYSDENSTETRKRKEWDSCI